ncbi:DUF1876 domain-containing protein [Streptomyces sp. URMC 123]|uniref:DUF1876 domain-containing protein n=1 Tax=Streptomyces sp. URMC 123 TaxID=3423403 RepID=UPI003F1A7EC2
METIVGGNIDMEFHEGGQETEADVRLRLRDGTEVKAHGATVRHPSDPARQRIGEEIAAARALNDLAKQLLDKASADISETTHQPTRLRH